MFGKTVAVEWNEWDRYQSVLGKVLLDGKDVNLEQIKADWRGITNSMTKISGGLINKYAEAQKAPSLKGIGLWSDLVPVAPWDFRHNKAAPSVAVEECEIRLAEFRYKIEPVICGFYRDALKSVSALSTFMESARLATRPGPSEAN